MTTARVTQVYAEALTAGNPNVLVTHEIVEVLSSGTPHALVTHLMLEVLTPTFVAAPSSAGQPVVFIVT